jgi:hypothetical protein
MTDGPAVRPLSTGVGFDPATWQSDAVAATPICRLTLPGTHHAAMVTPEPTVPERWDCQTRDVYTQLRDGIRFLDVRVWFDEADGTFYGHHASERGRSLEGEVFPQVGRYLSEVDEAGATEFVVLKLSHFGRWGPGCDGPETFRPEHWRALRTSLTEAFGTHALDIGSCSREAVLNTTVDEFDGPKLAVLYRTVTDHAAPPTGPSFAGRFDDWVSSCYPDTPTPGAVLAGGLKTDHADRTVLGETQWIIRKPADLYTDGRATNATLSLYESVLAVDPRLVPNVVRVDYYETSTVVALCVALSQRGRHPETAPPLPEGHYTLRDRCSGRALAVTGGADGTARLLDAAGPDSRRRVAFRRAGDGAYRVSHPDGDRVLAVESGDRRVCLRQWAGTAGQRWFAVPLRNGDYCLLNADTGMALERDGENSVTSGYWANEPRQRWRLEAAGAP